METVKIPVIIGRNRPRGNRTGAMVDETPGEAHLQSLQAILAKEARRQGVDPTDAWLRTATRQVLALYEQAHASWSTARNETIGLVYECTMPSGKIVLLGERRLLDRLTRAPEVT